VDRVVNAISCPQRSCSTTTESPWALFVPTVSDGIPPRVTSALRRSPLSRYRTLCLHLEKESKLNTLHCPTTQDMTTRPR